MVHEAIAGCRPDSVQECARVSALPDVKTCQKLWKKRGETGVGHYQKRNALPAPGCKNMLYKITSRYMAEFLAGHYIKNL